MIDIKQTDVYKHWFSKLKDRTARARIAARIRRMSLGNFGDTKILGKGVLELRIDYGPGYRVYFLKKEDMLIILLAGGDKSTQRDDIEKAKKVASELLKGQ